MAYQADVRGNIHEVGGEIAEISMAKLVHIKLRFLKLWRILIRFN